MKNYCYSRVSNHNNISWQFYESKQYVAELIKQKSLQLS